MKNESYVIIFICMAVFMVVPFVSAYEPVRPGGLYTCTNETIGLTIMCDPCTGNETCPENITLSTEECIIDAVMNPGEKLELTESPCNVEVRCAKCSEEDTDDVEYIIKARLDKSDLENILLDFEVYDPEDSVISNRSWNFNHEDVAKIEFDTNFTVKSQLYFSAANSRTCAIFWNDYQDKYGTDMSRYIIGTAGQCEEELAQCVKDKNVAEGQADSRLNTFTLERVKFAECQTNLTITQSNLDTAETTCETEKQGTVPQIWMLVAALGWVCFIMLGFFGFIYNSAEGGGMK